MLLAYHDLLSSLFSILFLLRNISSSHSIHPTIADWGSVTASVETSTGNWETDRGVWRFFFLAGARNQKITVQVPLGQDLKKEMDMSFPIPGNFFFFWRLFFEILIYFNFSNPSNLPENRSGEDWRELSINWFLPLEALCVRSWCLERFRRFIALQWSKTPWSQFGKRPGIFGLDWIFWYLSYVA